jgi:hypothetical protein
MRTRSSNLRNSRGASGAARSKPSTAKAAVAGSAEEPLRVTVSPHENLLLKRAFDLATCALAFHTLIDSAAGDGDLDELRGELKKLRRKLGL